MNCVTTYVEKTDAANKNIFQGGAYSIKLLANTEI